MSKKDLNWMDSLKNPDYLPTASEAHELVVVNIDYDYQEKRRRVIKNISEARTTRLILNYMIPVKLMTELGKAGYKVTVKRGLESETIIEF